MKRGSGAVWVCYWCRREKSGVFYLAEFKAGGYLEDQGAPVRFCPDCMVKLQTMAAEDKAFA
jgi:hypothetical protein